MKNKKGCVPVEGENYEFFLDEAGRVQSRPIRTKEEKEYDLLKQELQEVYDLINFKDKFEYIIVIPQSKYQILEDSIDKASPLRGHQIYGVPIASEPGMDLEEEKFKVYKRKK